MNIKEEYLQDLFCQDNDQQTHIFNGNKETILSDSDSDDENETTLHSIDNYSIITVLDNMRQYCDMMGLDWLNNPKSLEELLELLGNDI